MFPQDVNRVLAEQRRHAVNGFSMTAVEGDQAADLLDGTQLRVLDLLHEPRVNDLLVREDIRDVVDGASRNIGRQYPAPTSKRGLATRGTCQGRDVEKLSAGR